MKNKLVWIYEREMLGMSFTRWLPKANNLIVTIESTHVIVTEFSILFLP